MNKEWLITKWHRFLFGGYNQKLTRTLVGIFLVLSTALTAYIYLNADRLVSGPASNYLIGRNGTFKTVTDSSTSDSVNSNTQTPTQSGKTTKNGNQSSASSNSNSSDSDNDASTSPGSSPPSSPTADDVLSATVAFYADSQSDTDGEDVIHQSVVNAILGTSADPIFHAGDLLEDGTADSLNRFNNVTLALRSQRSFYSAQGNNERNSSVYFDNFVYPNNEHYYSVNVGNLHLVVLDNYATSVAVGSAQYNWLASDLQSAASQSRITGVMFHYPIYGLGGDTKGMIPTMVPLFQNYGVDFVISGHEHLYQKSIHDSIPYIVNSGMSDLGYMIAKVYSNSIQFQVYNNASGLVDSILVNKR